VLPVGLVELWGVGVGSGGGEEIVVFMDAEDLAVDGSGAVVADGEAEVGKPVTYDGVVWPRLRFNVSNRSESSPASATELRAFDFLVSA
jgi:hypothetical protein